MIRSFYDKSAIASKPSGAARKRKADDDIGRECKCFKSTFDSAITILAGLAKIKFIVHEDMICSRSRFLEAACSKKWLGGQEKIVTLPTVEHSPFQIYLEWAYGEKDLLGLINNIANIQASYHKTKSPQDQTWHDPDGHVLGAFLEQRKLGDYIGDISFTNAVVTAVYTRLEIGYEGFLWNDILDKVFEETPAGSTLQRLLVDHVADNSDGDKADFVDSLCQAFKSALLRNFLERQGTRKYKKKFDICKYHVHGEGIEECK